MGNLKRLKLVKEFNKYTIWYDNRMCCFFRKMNYDIYNDLLLSIYK